MSSPRHARSACSRSPDRSERSEDRLVFRNPLVGSSVRGTLFVNLVARRTQTKGGARRRSTRPRRLSSSWTSSATSSSPFCSSDHVLLPPAPFQANSRRHHLSGERRPWIPCRECCSASREVLRWRVSSSAVELTGPPPLSLSFPAVPIHPHPGHESIDRRSSSPSQQLCQYLPPCCCSLPARAHPPSRLSSRIRSPPLSVERSSRPRRPPSWRTW